ncbi:uncharacterized protein LOC131844562 [Achroia grisella]|uniref:uncharacterized protein LOC131844562 n=1 Tax=Achroia grisella TaxID=688607 RepID=UPI0027D2DB73|nr:uncharacterized protein LOC131844562 [Achroia grisella]
MADCIKYFISVTIIFYCDAATFMEQLEHIANRRQESVGISDNNLRRFNYGKDVSGIIGAPSRPNHLPEAEPILPGHTLIRPALGMLKSSVKFPHKDSDNGAGVYGNINNLGIRYDGKNERVLYSGFRRTPDPTPDYIMSRSSNWNNLFKEILLMNREKNAKENIMLRTESRELKSIEKPLELNEGLLGEINSDGKENKQQWFWNSKDAFTNIKINQDAPELSELIPPNTTQKLRQWWFYHQEDYKPFAED